MDLSIRPDETAIRAATIEMCGLSKDFAAHFSAARNLLLNVRWWRRDALVVFEGGIAAGVGHCSCAEGGTDLCLHKLAVRILRVAEERTADQASPLSEVAL